MIDSLFNPENFDFLAFIQVIVIDLIFSADNAIVIGIAAAGLPTAQRKKAIAIGIGAAVVLLGLEQDLPFGLIGDGA